MDTIELVKSAVAGDVLKTKEVFDTLVGQSVVDKVDAMRGDVAAQMFNAVAAVDDSEQEEEQEEENTDQE